MHTTPDQLRSLSDSLLNVSGNVPLHERFRALFTLKAVGGEEAVKIIAEGECQNLLSNPTQPNEGMEPGRFSKRAERLELIMCPVLASASLQASKTPPP